VSAGIQPPTFFFGISSPLPVFYQQQGEIQKAEVDLQSQTIQRSKLEAQVVNDVEAAYNAFLTTRRIMERYQGVFLERARVARDITKRQYDAGAATLMDYLDAQRTFIATNLDYLQTLTNYWTAVFQLETAVGMELRR
jgi:cobalt-zinc-cadmium efflux system outer membrane protein